MKKLIALLLALMLLISLSACQSEPKNNDNDKDDKNPPAASQQAQQEEEKEPQGGGEEEPDPPAEPHGLDLTLNAPNQEYEVATIILFPDFTFELTVNLLEGFGMVKGTYTINDSIINCTLTDKSQLSGFSGEELETFRLEPQDAHSYVMMMDGTESIGALKNETPFYQ